MRASTSSTGCCAFCAPAERGSRSTGCRTFRNAGWRSTAPLPSGQRHCQYCLTADRVGGEACRLHVEFGFSDAVELGAQPCLGPQAELTPEAVFLLEKDRRARRAQHFV